MQLDSKILATAEELFLKYGIKSVSMDDISRQVGISKKTLYDCIENKKDLVGQIVAKHREDRVKAFHEIRANAKNVIDEMMEITRHTIVKIRRFKPTVIYDLRKYYRENWKSLEKLQCEFVKEFVMENFNKGVKEGLYRDDIDNEMASNFYTYMALLLLDEDKFPIDKFERGMLCAKFIQYHLRGIATQKGINILNKMDWNV